jgi:hypothetical protein
VNRAGGDGTYSEPVELLGPGWYGLGLGPGPGLGTGLGLGVVELLVVAEGPPAIIALFPAAPKALKTPAMTP